MYHCTRRVLRTSYFDFVAKLTHGICTSRRGLYNKQLIELLSLKYGVHFYSSFVFCLTEAAHKNIAPLAKIFSRHYTLKCSIRYIRTYIYLLESSAVNGPDQSGYIVSGRLVGTTIYIYNWE